MSEKANELLKLKKDQILFLAGEEQTDLYFVKSGKVLVFVQNGSQITPVAYLGAEEFIGELSFFDQTKRSASIICVENSEIYQIKGQELYQYLPKWMQQLGLQLSKKIRNNDEIIRTRGIRKTKVETIKPLRIEEQSKIYKLIEEYKKN